MDVVTKQLYKNDRNSLSFLRCLILSLMNKVMVARKKVPEMIFGRNLEEELIRENHSHLGDTGECDYIIILPH